MMFSTTARPLDWLEASLSASVIADNISFGGVLNFYTKRFNFYIGSDRFFGRLWVNSFNANVNLGVTIPLEDYYERRRR
ncbi:MAG: DUF5723 family protein, partial [Capnocytophaga sp.]|nr:DUF5723 family protein [Capnocytophaga sp.]